ncbi:hypothetical protein [Thermoflexus hugenholtzii]
MPYPKLRIWGLLLPGGLSSLNLTQALAQAQTSEPPPHLANL